MSPTIFRARGYRFFFFSREEPRMHVHVYSGHGEAKFWMEPEIELVTNHGLRSDQLGIIQKLIQEHEDEICTAWNRHFSG